MSPTRVNEVWADTLVGALWSLGLRDVCVSPGSRSTPVVLALAQRPDITTHVHLDERSAAFFALGIGKASGRAAAVVTTSGTAVANLFPAVVEAAQSQTPLFLLTADRPPELRGADANQAIDQFRIFGTYARQSLDAGVPEFGERRLRHLTQLVVRGWEAAHGVEAGPVHLNLPFRKPLEPSRRPDAETALAGSEDRGADDVERLVEHSVTKIISPSFDLSSEGRSALASLVEVPRRALIVAGPVADPHDAEGIRRLAAATGFPLLADPLSGARSLVGDGHRAVAGYDVFLRSEKLRRALAPDCIVRVGRGPTSQRVLNWLASTTAPQWVIDPGGRWKDHLGKATQVLRSDAASAAAFLEGTDRAAAPPGWWEVWHMVSEAAGRAMPEALASHECEGAVAHHVVEALPDGSALFVSGSMPVRDLDAYMLPHSKDVLVLGNRGASGIDGIISTALGTAHATRRPTAVLVGDVAFYHDMNGLMAARVIDTPVVFVLVNNDGGGIFHRLPIREWDPAFTRFFATPHGLAFEHAASLHGLPHRKVSIGDVGGALEAGLNQGGVRILEVRTDREAHLHSQREVEGRIVEAAERALRESQPRGQ